MRTVFARWKANPQPLIQFGHPRILGRRAAVAVNRGDETLREAFRRIVIAPIARAYVLDLSRRLRLEFDRKARKRKQAARARCGYRRR